MDVEGLEKALAEEQAAEAASMHKEAATREDYWAPTQSTLAEGGVDTYGPISPIPDHDGTECLKWDSSLWSHGDHFKVAPGPGDADIFAGISEVLIGD